MEEILALLNKQTKKKRKKISSSNVRAMEVTFLGSSPWEPGGVLRSKAHESKRDPLRAQTPVVSFSHTSPHSAPAIC